MMPNRAINKIAANECSRPVRSDNVLCVRRFPGRKRRMLYFVMVTVALVNSSSWPNGPFGNT